MYYWRIMQLAIVIYKIRKGILIKIIYSFLYLSVYKK